MAIAGRRPARLERAIGVIYLPATKPLSHYFEASLPAQFDAVRHLDATRALPTRDRAPVSQPGAPPETYSSALQPAPPA